MNILIRSTFKSKPTERDELILQNYLDLAASGLECDGSEEKVLWNYISEFVKDHQHTPSASTIREHFDRIQEHTVVDHFEMLMGLEPKFQGDFRVHLKAIAEEHRIRKVNQILSDAKAILTAGVTVKEGKKQKTLKGTVDAIRYVMDAGQEVVTPITGARLSGNVTKDGTDFAEEYLRVEADPLAGVGQYTGIEQLDTSIRGAKRQELWLHAAFTGGMKSTFTINWAYNQAVYYNFSSLIYSLEMPYVQVRRILYAIHSGHEKFDGLRPTKEEDQIDVDKLKYGELSQKAKDFLLNHVVPDFNDPNNHYGNILIEVANPDKGDTTVGDIKARAEALHSSTPFQLMFIDHALLVSPKRWVASTTERLNEVLRDCKRLAMNFNRGEGMAVCCLFQISREGYKSAMKKGEKDPEKRGEYDLTHLSYANEAERSSDIVTATWIDDDLRKESMVKFQCLKTRDSGGFDRFSASVDWKIRRIKTLDTASYGVDVQQAVQKADDQILNAI
jgi:hypothetical protein